MIMLTARQEDKAADKIAAWAKAQGVKKIYGIAKGGWPLAIKVSYRLNDLPLAETRSQITKDTIIVEDIIHSGKTIRRLLVWLERRGVRPKAVACWVWRTSALYKPDKAILKVSSGKPVKFPSETKKSALKSFKLSEAGR